MKEPWERVFLEPLETLRGYMTTMLPNLLAMTIILAGGFLVSVVMGHLIERLSRAIGLDHFTNRVGMSATLMRDGVRQDTPYLAGRATFWFMLILTILAGLSSLNLPPVNQFIQSFLGYIPHVLTSIVILAVGYLLSNFVSQAVLIAAVNAELLPARMVAAYVRWGVLFLAVTMALEQLGIAQQIVVVAFSLAFGAVIMAMALAFGLGATDLAKEFLERQFGKNEGRSKNDLTHL